MSVVDIVEDVTKEIIDKVMILSSKSVNSVNEESLQFINTDVWLEKCRICYETDQIIPIVYPCKCKGTMGAIHLICLERWLAESNTDFCELCGHKFHVVRLPKYNVLQSFWVWIRSDDEEYRSQVRSLRVDLIRCLVVTPLTIIFSYLCLILADSYSTGYRNGYTVMIILIISYLIWIYLTTQHHHRRWFHWWKKKIIVKILFPQEDYSKIQQV